jgi:hypothetical protein
MAKAKIAKPPTSFQSPFTVSIRRAISDFKLILTLVAVFGSIIAAYYTLRLRIGLPEPLLTIVSLAPLVLFGVFYLLPEWREASDRRRLDELSVKGKIKKPGYFRLIPYTERDSSDFFRSDDAKTTTVEWISASQVPVLYLYGQSGVGKSSLINAAIIPTLKQSTPSWIVVQIRIQIDPLESIKLALLKPDAIWRNPPRDENVDVFHIVERAERYVRDQKKMLLLVFDQFEEIFILLGSASRSQLTELLQRLSNRSMASLRVLLSLRAEYLSDLITLQLPPPTLGSNCLEVRPFTQAAARDLLERSELDLGRRLIEKAMAEAAKIEDMPDRIRPVVLNMIGLVLASFKGNLPKGVTPGQLLAGYVYRAISATDIRSYAPPVLRTLITAVGTKQALSVQDIAEKIKLPTNVTRGCLIRLANEGLVRRIDDERWEISHDFVARLIQPLVQTWHKSGWETARSILAPASLVVWLGMVGVTALSAPRIQESIALARLARAGIVPTGSGGFITTDLFYRLDEKELGSTLSYFGWVQLSDVSLTILRDETDSVRHPELYQTLVSTFVGWPSLSNLAQLYLTAKDMRNLVGMPTFPRLTQFSLQAYELNDLSGMPVQPSLLHFNLESAIASNTMHSDLHLIGMPILPRLEDLRLCSIGADLSGLPPQPNLRSLTLCNASNVASPLKGMPVLPKLETIHLLSAFDLSEMPAQPSLRELTSQDQTLSANKFPIWLNIEAIDTFIGTQQDVNLLSDIAPKLKGAKLHLRGGDSPLDWSKLKGAATLRDLSLCGDLNDLKFLSEMKALSKLYITLDNDRCGLRRYGNELDFDSLSSLRKDIEINLEMYRDQVSIPRELAERLHVEYLPDKF